MSTRISSALALVLLAPACSRGDPGEAAANAGEKVECALAGAASFARDCTAERVRFGNGLQLIVRHPGGAFRRFDVVGEGQGLATADGAQTAQVTLRDNGFDVAVGQDRYRFPAALVRSDGK